MDYVYHNGKMELYTNVTLHLNNRNFLYGDGLFESIRCMNGKPMFLQYHTERLQRGVKVLKLHTQWAINEQALSKAITELNQQNGHREGVRIRLVIGRNAGNTYKPDELSSSIYISSSPTPGNYYSWPEEGLAVGLFDEIKKPLNVFSDFKTCNSLLYVMASVYFSENKLDDCLLLNVNNNICEGSSSNLFWIKNNALYTPPLSDGCINGVLRTLLSVQYKAEEKTCTTEELMNADELFLTNMGTGIRWIKSFNGKTYKCSYTHQLFNRFNKMILTGSLC